MNSSDEYWSITAGDGEEVSLHQFGWSVTTVGGSRYDLPPKRGSNMAVAYRPGQIYRRKTPDSRQITLIMWMVGWQPDQGPLPGVNPLLSDQRNQWNDNWDFLRRLVYKANLVDGRVVLTRRWFLTAPAFPTTRTGDQVIAGDPGTAAPGVARLVTAVAAAEMTGSMAPSMTGRTRADFQLDFTLPDPYFFGPPVAVSMPNSANPVYVWNDGHDVANYSGVSIDFIGPLTNPVLTNLATSPSHSVKYTGTIPAGQTLTLVPGRFTASQHANGVTSPYVNKIAGITNGGARQWINLMPGANKLTFTASSGTGSCLLKFQPPYV